MNENKMPTEKKIRITFLLEYVILAIVALVVGVLKMAGVIPTKPTRLLIYNIISIVGAAYFIIEIVWYFLSEKKRQRTDLLDKLIVLPVLLYLLAFDIYCFIYYGKPMWDIFVTMSIGSALTYVGLVYIFLGIYRYKHPSKMILEAIKEVEESDKKLEEDIKDKVEEIEGKDKEQIEEQGQ